MRAVFSPPKHLLRHPSFLETLYPSTFSLTFRLEITMSNQPFLSRRQFNMALSALAATPLMVERARAASSLVAATFPNAWEDAYRRVLAPMLSAQGTGLVIAPALA